MATTKSKSNSKRGDNLRVAVERVRAAAPRPIHVEYPIKPPEIAPGVVPTGRRAPVLAMDYAGGLNPYTYAQQVLPGYGFPGFQYLAMLATRAEYRAFASTISTEVTRRWIEFTSTDSGESESVKEKIKLIEKEFERLNVRGIIQDASAQDCLYGRAQIFINIDGADRKAPLILDPRAVKKGSFRGLSTVEAVWTTPSAYNALDPSAPDFYRPSAWFMLGQEVHASRLLTVLTRPLPDILKPAYNFAGISLSQLAEPYVNNWLRTRQSVSDLINNFSISVLKTSMDQALTGGEADDLIKRADFFTLIRSNKGLMMLDMDREDLVQVNTPLGGLHELQAQAQEHMCSVSKIPAVILTGISPSGLNASSDGEIRVFYDWIAAQQEAFWRQPIGIVLKCVQLSLFGEIDPAIGFAFVPLYQMSEKEKSEIRESTQRTSSGYIADGVLDPSEVREHLATDPDSGYEGIDAGLVIVPPAGDLGEK